MSKVVVIDISFWQQNVNYAELAKNIDGVILRAAYSTAKDTMFDAHYKAFDDLGIPVGAYHYIIGSADPTDQARAFAKAVQGKKLRLGVWNDVEDQKNGLTREKVLRYHTEAEKLVGEMGVYTSAYKWDTIMGQPDLLNRKLWVANYQTTSPMLPRTGGWQMWWLWQYTEHGRLPGYHSNLDINNFWGDKADFAAWIGDVSEPEPTPEPPEGAMFVIEMLGNMSIRDKPSVTDGRVLDYALRGEVHHSDQEQDGWYKITRYSITGWLSGLTQWTRITEVEPDPEPEPQPPDPPLTLEERVARLEEAVFGDA